MASTLTLDHVVYFIETKGKGREQMMLARWLDARSGASGAAVFLAGELELGGLSDRLSFHEEALHCEALRGHSGLSHPA